jgi:RNA polymerase sigma factor (sigma-70 family)
VITHVMYEKLHCSLDKLSQAEKQLIQALYYEGLSEREYAARIGISQKGVNKRKHAIQKKLRKMLEK